MDKILQNRDYAEFLDQLKQRVASGRYQAALKVNSELILLYHHIGSEILKRQKERGWGAKIIDQLSKDLRAAFPEMKGFSVRNLNYMRLFAEEYADPKFVQQVVAQLPWGHIITPAMKQMTRDVPRELRWSVRRKEHYVALHCPGPR